MTEPSASPAATKASRSSSLGAAIRQARSDKGLSVRALAREIGKSAAFISAVERGITAPSVGTLYEIANTLDVSIDSLMECQEVGPVVAAVPAAKASRAKAAPRRGSKSTWEVDLPAMDTRDATELLRSLPPTLQPQVQRAATRRSLAFSSGVIWERLTPSSDHMVDFLEIVYPPNSSSMEDGKQTGHDGREYGLVLQGRLTLHIGEEEIELGPGDSITFDSSVPHQYRNDGQEVARAAWLVIHQSLS